MSDATTGRPAANASVSTIPNDSPPSDGAHEQVGVEQRGVAGGVVDAAERRHAGAVHQQRRDLVLGGADDRQLGRHHARAAPRRRAAARAGPCARRPGRRTRSAAARPERGGRGGAACPPAGRATPLGMIAVVAAVEAPAGPRRRLGHGQPQVQPVQLAARAEQPGDLVRRDRTPSSSGTCRRAGRRCSTARPSRRPARPARAGSRRRERRRAARGASSRPRRAVREVRDRAVRRPADRAAERDQPLGRRRAPAGARHGARRR